MKRVRKKEKYHKNGYLNVALLLIDALLTQCKQSRARNNKIKICFETMMMMMIVVIVEIDERVKVRLEK
jgi:hypothetical protein